MRDSPKYNVIIYNVPHMIAVFVREAYLKKIDETSHMFKRLFWLDDHAFTWLLL